MLQHPPDVVGQLLDRRVAIVGHALHRHQRDRVDVARRASLTRFLAFGFWLLA